MNLKTNLLLIALLAVSVAFAQKETRKLGSFDAISVSESINVELIPGNKNEAIVDVSGSVDLEDVITEVRGSTLKIEMADRRGGYRSARVFVKLTYQNIEEIRASSSSDVFTSGVLQADQLEVEVSSSADVELEVDVEEIDVRVSSSGDCRIEGTAVEQDIRVSSSGDYYAYDLKSQRAKVDVSSSGGVKIYVTEEIDADASSSGSVYYKGDPEKVYVNASSSGKVRKY